jgi:hypothetical protein
MNELPSPIIIVGMHRSGTTMLIRVLEAAGLFAGLTGDNHEAVFFYRIDQWLMEQSGATWENPEPTRYLLENKEVRRMATDYIARYLIKSPRVTSFLGWKDYLRYRSVFNLPMPWGWKCPLATYTLPIWLDVFPTAKVIHIYRHGVDVANSLRKRALNDLKRTPRQELYYKFPFLHWMKPKVGGFVAGMRCATLDGAFSLWEEYLSEARSQTQKLGNRATEVRYEDFLSEPNRGLKQLTQFCSLTVSDDKLEKATAQITRERAYAYRSRSELRVFTERVAQRLVAQGYHESPTRPRNHEVVQVF